MAKQYRIDAIINTRQAVGSARTLGAELEKLDRIAQKAINRAQQAASKMGAASQRAAQTTAQARASSTGGLEDKYLLREYNRRVACAKKMEQLADRKIARELSQQAAAQRKLQQAEDRYLKREYDNRVAWARKREQQAAAATARNQAMLARDAAKLAEIEDRYLKREYDQRVVWARRKQQLADREAARDLARKQRDADRLQTIEDRYLKREHDRRVAHERTKEVERQRAANKAIKDKDRELKEIAAIEDKWLRREQRERVAWERRKMERADAAADERQANTESVVTRGGAAALTIGIGGLQAFYRSLQEVNDRALEGARALQEYRQQLRVEAVLRGSPQSDNKTLSENVGLRLASGMTAQEASDFNRQFEGSLPVGIEKGNITRDVADKFKVAAATRASRMGGDANTHGDLAGILGQFTKITSVGQGLGKLEAIRYGLTEGRGDDTPLTKQFLEAAGTLVGEGSSISTPEELAALIGVTSLKNPNEAATLAVQLNRALKVGLTKHTTRGGAKESQGNYLKRLGVTEQDSLESALDKVAPDLTRATAQGRDLQAYLREHGMIGEEERLALITAFRNYQPLKHRFAKARALGASSGADQVKANAAFLASPQGRNRISAASSDANETAIALQNERFAALRNEATASKEFRSEEMDPNQWWYDRGWGLMSGHVTDPGEFGKELRIQGHMDRILKQKAKQAGVTDEQVQQAWSDSHHAGQHTIDDVIREYTNRVEGLIEQRNGANQVDTVTPMKNLAESLDKLRLQMEKANPGGKAPAPLPGAPRVGAVRP